MVPVQPWQMALLWGGEKEEGQCGKSAWICKAHPGTLSKLGSGLWRAHLVACWLLSFQGRGLGPCCVADSQAPPSPTQLESLWVSSNIPILSFFFFFPEPSFFFWKDFHISNCLRIPLFRNSTGTSNQSSKSKMLSWETVNWGKKVERGKPSSSTNLKEYLLSHDHRRGRQRTKTETGKGQDNSLPMKSKFWGRFRQ